MRRLLRLWQNTPALHTCLRRTPGHTRRQRQLHHGRLRRRRPSRHQLPRHRRNASTTSPASSRSVMDSPVASARKSKPDLAVPTRVHRGRHSFTHARCAEKSGTMENPAPLRMQPLPAGLATTNASVGTGFGPEGEMQAASLPRTTLDASRIPP